jgi:hypothetical protein
MIEDALRPIHDLALPGYGLADRAAMTQLRRCAVRAEKRGLWKSLGSITYRHRALVGALFPRSSDVRWARAHSNKGGLRQRWERLLLVALMRMHPDTYYRLCLHDPERYARAGEFVCFRQLRNLLAYMLEVVDPDVRATLMDKAKFYQFCRGQDIATPRILATWRPDSASFDLGEQTRSLFRHHGQVFFKPAAGMCGIGAGVLSTAAHGCWEIRSGQGPIDQLEWKDVEAYFRTAKDAFVFQERLRNHVDLASFGQHALHTVRLTTFRLNGKISPQAASLRIASRRTVADNFAAGGVAVKVDVASGRLGTGAMKAHESAPASLEVLPDTGQTFKGVTLPHWAESLALACRLHGLLAALPSIGHDIAITDQGPVIVEANENWDGDLLQKPSDSGLGRSAFPALIAEHFPSR